MPRLVRTVVWLSSLGLLVLPTGLSAQAQVEGELAGRLFATGLNVCAEHTPENALDHKRCARGAFTSITEVALEATRDVGGDLRTATCTGTVPADQAIGFTTRENLAEGRGLISPAVLDLGAGSGTVVDADGQATAPCHVRISGTFHRVANVLIGRLFVDVHVDLGGTRQFRHTYCAGFDRTVVPTGLHLFGGPRLLVTFVVEGRRGCDDGRNPDEAVFTHGRRPADDADRHGGECPSGHLPVPVNCD